MADGKTKSEDMVPQADKEAATELAKREGTDGAQAKHINKDEAEKRTGKRQDSSE